MRLEVLVPAMVSRLLQFSFQPAIALNHRLKYPHKFALISVLFMLPLGVALCLLNQEMEEQKAFTRAERQGLTYLAPIQKLWHLYPQWYFGCDRTGSNLSYTYQSQRHIEAQIQQQRQALDQLLAIETSLKLSSTAQKFRAIADQMPRCSENSLVENNGPLIQGQIESTYPALMRSLNSLREQTKNASNLALDPDLDSYYAMLVTTQQLPELGQLLAEIQRLAREIQRHPQGSQYPFQLALSLAEVNKQSSNLLKDLGTAFNGNPNRQMQPRLGASLSQLTQLLSALEGELSTAVNAPQKLRPDQIFHKADQIAQASQTLNQQVSQQLDNLLQERLERLAQRQQLMVAFVLIILLIVLYQFIGFYLGVMETVEALNQAALQMTSGNLQSDLKLKSRDELALVVKSFNRISAALVQSNRQVTQLNTALTEENNRMGSELDITRRLQQMILPKPQELDKIPSLDIVGFMQPAHEVGGDYYDVLPQPNGQVKIGIGDVTGHGLESGVLMIMVQTAVRTLLESQITDPVQFFNILNRTIYGNVQRMDSDKNLTLTVLDYADSTLKVAGQHEEMLVIRQGGLVERLDTIDLGFPIGLEEDIADFIAQTQVKLNPGDGVVLYTDGITEAENQDRKQYGLDRLCTVVSDHWHQAATDIRKAVVDDLQSFIGGHTIFDDITLLVCKQK
jgi:serine phosphatase RsbU (regulator of sigma subunit)